MREFYTYAVVFSHFAGGELSKKPCFVGKLGQTSTDFEVKQRKSARMVGIDQEDAWENRSPSDILLLERVNYILCRETD